MTEPSASAPSEVPSPLLVASWERLGLLPTDRVPLWATYWVAGGHDGEALIYLAGLHGEKGLPPGAWQVTPDAKRVPDAERLLENVLGRAVGAPPRCQRPVKRVR